MSNSREPMSPVDTAWLRMENARNLMMIGGVLILEKPIDIDRFKRVLEKRFLKFHRFRQRVQIDANGKAWWEDDPAFNIDHHVHRVGLPGKANKAELQKLASDINSTSLDFRHPLWQMHVVDNYHKGGAVIVRIHHCIADGIALVRVLLSFTDDAPDDDLNDREEAHHNHEGLIARLTHTAEALYRQTLHWGHELVEEGAEIIRHPSHLMELANKGLEIGAELTRIGLMPFDPKTRFKGSLSGRKVVAWAEPLDLDEVKATAHALHGTLNDILMATATGAVREYLLHKGDDVSELDVHVAVPFNLRPLDRPITQLGNQFGLVVVRLPISVADPMKRFQAVRDAMHELKHSHQPHVFYGMLSMLGKGPAILEQTALELLSKKASMVMTNVPGPHNPRYLAGARIVQPMVWVPQSGDVGVGLSILSYAGTVQFGVVGDHHLIDDPELLVRQFHRSYKELAQCV